MALGRSVIEYSLELCQHLGRVHHVLEDHVRDDRIEARVAEWEPCLGALRESLVVRCFVKVGPENLDAGPPSPADSPGVATTEIKNAGRAGFAGPVEHEPAVDMQPVCVESGFMGHEGPSIGSWALSV